MSTDQPLRPKRLWLFALAACVLGASIPLESGATNARKECIAGCKASKKDCIGRFKAQLTTAKAICNDIRGKADRKQCNRDLRPRKAAFKTGKQDCWREFKKNCKQCCKQDPVEDCRTTSFIVCGDGNTSGVEECDDGDRNDGDGCSRTCQLEARCGDGRVDPNEECEEHADCTLNERCVSCSCRPDCENDLDCAAGEACVAGACIPPLGTRIFSLGEESTLRSSFLPQFTLGIPRGDMELVASSPDENGTATVTTPADGAPHFVTLDIAALGQQLTICSQIVSCEGTLYCSGGANVDVEVELNSLAKDLTCGHGSQCSATDPCCDNSCEGSMTEDSWTPVTSGNLPLNRTGVRPGEDSGPGAMVITCQVAAGDFPLGTDCTTAIYGDAQSMILTTGKNTARVINHCPGVGAPPATAPEFSQTGANFDCSAWTREDGAGALAFSLPIEEPSNLLTGDGAQAGIYDD